MPNLFTCRCGQRFAVQSQHLGQRVRCPHCAQVLLLPAPAAAVTAKPPPRQLPAPPRPVPSRRLRCAGALVVLLATGGGVLLYQHNRTTNAPPEQETRNEGPTSPHGKQSPPNDSARPDKLRSVSPSAGELETQVLARINAARLEVGLASVTLDAELSRACLQHAREGRASENGQLFPGTPLAAFDGALASWLSRLPFLDPNLERVGVGPGKQSSGEPGTAFAFARSAAAANRTTAILYPVDGQKDVLPSFPGNEVPDPVPESVRKVVGYPVTVTFPPRTSIRQATGRMTDARGKEVPAWFSSPEKPANPQFRLHQGTTLCLIARDVLRPGSAYTVEMSASVRGAPWSRTWRFTTTTPERQTAGLAGRLLGQLNAVRKAAGLEPLALDEELSKACRAHAAYLARNADRLDDPDFDQHDENAKLPGTSAEGKRIAREAHVGTASFPPEAMLASWPASFHYRFPLLDQQSRKVGLAAARGPRNWHLVLALKPERGLARSAPLLYPADGQKDVPVAYESGEVPDPIPESKDRQAGFPITVLFPPRQRVADVTAALTLGGAAVPFWMSTPQKPVADGYQHNTVCAIARRPLRPDSVYKVRIAATVDGKPWERTWTFRTARKRPEQQRAVALNCVAALNAHRRRAGLPPVVLDAELSRGCQAHARYLLLNTGQPSTRGLGIHKEDAKLPGYTAEGEAAGQASVIAAGVPPVAAVEDWMATLYHRVPLLNPALGHVGFGLGRGGPQGWLTVVNAIAGVNRPPVLLFPASGQKNVPVGDGSGYPLTITFPPGRTVRVVKVSLTEGGGQEVAVSLLAPEDSEAARRAHTVCVLPRAPLRPGTTYEVKASARVNGKPWTQTWRFATALAE